jgi:hypothetical protein
LLSLCFSVHYSFSKIPTRIDHREGIIHGGLRNAMIL